MSLWGRKLMRHEAVRICRTLVRQYDITNAELAPRIGPKVTIGPCLGYDPRYQIAPGARVHGAGFASVGIGRDVDTGRGWGS
jgi:hypothetical protein